MNPTNICIINTTKVYTLVVLEKLFCGIVHEVSTFGREIIYCVYWYSIGIGVECPEVAAIVRCLLKGY